MERKSNIFYEYIVQDRQTGTFIDEFSTEDEALAAIEDYEIEDENNGCYEPDFYEVVKKHNDEQRDENN